MFVITDSVFLRPSPYLSIYIDFPIDIVSIFVMTDSFFYKDQFNFCKDRFSFCTTDSFFVTIDSIFVITDSGFVRRLYIRFHSNVRI